MPKIVIPGFCPIHFTITFARQTNKDRYFENIVIPKIVKPGVPLYFFSLSPASL